MTYGRWPMLGGRGIWPVVGGAVVGDRGMESW